jgi:hypothetical protein
MIYYKLSQSTNPLIVRAKQDNKQIKRSQRSKGIESIEGSKIKSAEKSVAVKSAIEIKIQILLA